MKKTIFNALLFILIFSQQVALSQISISPNHTVDGNGACPDVSVTYTVNGIPQGCSIVITLKSGNVVSFDADNSNKKFTVTWSDVPQKAEVRIKAASGTCISETVKEVPVMSVFGLAPTITGCPPSVVIGKSESFEMTAQLLYQFKGVNDPGEVGEYQWEIVNGGAGWNITNINQNGIVNKKAQIVTDNQNGATIRVRGRSLCGKWSDWELCTISRFVKAPCPIIGAPTYVVCEDTETRGMLATVTSGLSGYTYHWTWPAGWNGSATGPAGVVTPNGLNGGTVTLVAKAFGLTSSPCTANIALEPIEPSTQAIGDQFLCDDEPGLYKLDITPPPSSAITWSVSPSIATTPSSGTGQSASTSASGSYNGNATITFTINTPCGTKTRQKTFFVGRPKITNVKVDGKSGTFVYICPNDGLGSHWISLSLQGDQNNCIDEWDDFGTTATSYETCTEFDFTLQYNPNNNPPYNCVFVNAIASNECGITTQNIIACPSYWACKDVKYEFEISPNPASTTINVELYLDKNGNREQVDFDFIQLIDNHGNMLQSHQVTGQSIQLDVSNLQKGLYYLRTWIDEGYVMEELLIEK